MEFTPSNSNLKDENVELLIKYFKHYYISNIGSENNELILDIDNFINMISSKIGNVKKIPETPLYGGFTVTSNCNLNCIHCWSTAVNKNRYLPAKKLDPLIDRLSEAKILKIVLSGGEPFIRTDILDIIKQFKEYNIVVNILTNGILITKKHAEFLSSILKSDVDLIQISLDGSAPGIHDHQRNSKCFNKVINSIKLLQDNNINLRVHFVATHKNVTDMVNTYQFVETLGVDTFSVVPVFPMGKGTELYPLLDEYQYHKMLASCLEHEQSSHQTKFIGVPTINIFNLINEYWDDELGSISLPICNLQEFVQMSLNETGEVIPGNELFFPEFRLGNLFEKSLKEIWNNIKKTELSKGRNLLGTKCEHCKFLRLCKGGSMFLTYQKYHTFDKPDPTCKLIPNDK